MRLAIAGFVAAALALIAAAPAFIGGCAAPMFVVTAGATAARAGTAAYIDGELRAARLADLDQAWEALQAVIEESRFEVRSAARDEQAALADLGGPGEAKVRIRLSRPSPAMTRIRIRVGPLGDPAVSRLLLERFDAHLMKVTGRPHGRATSEPPAP